MTKILTKEINHCWACPNCKIYNVATMDCSCQEKAYHQFNRAEVNSDSPDKYFPSWCPLPNKQEKGENDNGKY